MGASCVQAEPARPPARPPAPTLFSDGLEERQRNNKYSSLKGQQQKPDCWDGGWCPNSCRPLKGLWATGHMLQKTCDLA